MHDDDDHALDLIEEISEYARGPLIVLLGSHESHFVSSAAERGIDAFARPQFDDEVQGAIELVMKRHAEKAQLVEQVEQLESALERRGTIERAKGILMERHGVDERQAFELMRQQARRSNRRVVELAARRRRRPLAAAQSRRVGARPVTCALARGTCLAMVDKLKQAFKEFQADEMADRAAALTYYMMMSLFPALLVGVSLLGLLGDQLARHEGRRLRQRQRRPGRDDRRASSRC